MSLTLILIRHAKSDWDNPRLSDHDRPLNRRGRRSALRVGAWLAGQGVVPDKILCSSAMRTQETWAGVAPFLPTAPAPDILPSLYHSWPGAMLETIREVQGARCVALVGHNPGIGGLAELLAAAVPAPAHEAFSRYPTCATTIFEFSEDTWDDVRPHTGKITRFVIPRELPDPE